MRGSCLCGIIQFEIRGDLSKIYQHHCSLCRKQGGSSSNSALVVETHNFSWITRQEGISSFVKPTGFRSDFCSRCGAPVPNPLRGMACFCVPAGLLDDDADIEIGVHIFVGSKASWDRIDTGVAQYETMPGLSEFVRLPHSGHEGHVGRRASRPSALSPPRRDAPALRSACDRPPDNAQRCERRWSQPRSSAGKVPIRTPRPVIDAAQLRRAATRRELW